MKPEIIAFYLPQFHPTPHNNEWWGEGFTEWVNVAKAKPLFPGHYQPKIPADLGFYDLRIPQVRQQQVELACQAGVTGFCYYHYWFGNGHEELEHPFNEVVRLGEPDFPFCLCWANESWYKKMWNKDHTMRQGSKVLAKQKYLGEEDNKMHFLHLLKAFKDSRYINVDGKLIFMIYKPLEFEDVDKLIVQWNDLAKEHSFAGFHFVGYSFNVDTEYERIKALGFDAVCSCRLNRNVNRNFGWAIRKSISMVFRIPRKTSYKKIIKTLITETDTKEDIYPTILPNWDHTPRSGINGDLYVNSNPNLFGKHVKEALLAIKNKRTEHQVLFLKSWNEWGEGNYMEPDLKFGHGYIKALRKEIDNFNNY